jgi:hypothetical protein
MRSGAWILSVGLPVLLGGGRFLTFTAAASALAPANVDPAHSVTTSDWIGALNWWPSQDSGASVNQYYCSGSIYGPEIGWISLGSGVPADKFHYRNNSGGDFGVNVLPGGALRGFAYGANIGWINFEETGNPNVDFVSGRLQGQIWSANAGWINLSNGSQFLSLAFLPEPLDSDGDGLPDAWEMEHAGNLTALSGNNDSDGDGQTDLEEYLAGTDPLDAKDFLGPLKLIVALDSSSRTLQWPTKKNYSYRIETRHSFGGSSNWVQLDGTLATGSGATASVTLPSSVDSETYYRVRAFPPLSAAQWTGNP